MINHFSPFWLIVIIVCLFIQGFYSMMEMATVSFNKIRLHYLVSKNNKQAKRLFFLLSRPHRLFGTVMLGVNIALQIGSQSAREFYLYLNINPDFSPFSQIFLVIIFGELLPLSISRKIPEKIALKGSSILYFSHYLFFPFTKFLGWITHGIYKLLKIEKENLETLLNRDEFQKILEMQHEENDFNIIATNIFFLKQTSAKTLMQSLKNIQLLPSSSTVSDFKKLLKQHNSTYIPVYHKEKSDIIGIACAKSFIDKTNDSLLINNLIHPWFVSDSMKLLAVLKQFRENHSSVALISNKKGEVIGLLSLRSILTTIFNTRAIASKKIKNSAVIERTFPGNTSIDEIKRNLKISLPKKGFNTLAQLVISLLEGPIEEGAVVKIDNFSLEIKEVSLSKIKSITIRTL